MRIGAKNLLDKYGTPLDVAKAMLLHKLDVVEAHYAHDVVGMVDIIAAGEVIATGAAIRATMPDDVKEAIKRMIADQTAKCRDEPQQSPYWQEPSDNVLERSFPQLKDHVIVDEWAISQYVAAYPEEKA